MLGLRRYKNIQVDLWQGDIMTFATDATVTLPDFGPSRVFSAPEVEDLAKKIRGLFETSDLQLKRHISVPVQASSVELAAEAAFKAIKNFVDTASPNVLRRVTFVASDEKIYAVLQHHLFARFPDELDEKGY